METKEIRVMRVRRYSLTSAKPFEQVAAAFERGLGLAAFTEFMRFDMGAILSKDGRTVKCVRYVIGNQSIMKEMARRVIDAASYEPVTVLIDERADGTHLSYDLMADYLLPYENAETSRAARELDERIEQLLEDAA